MVVLKSRGFWSTTATWVRNHAASSCRTLTPSNSTLPASGSYRRWMRETSVDLPLPLRPTRATVVPAGMVRLMPVSAVTSGREG